MVRTMNKANDVRKAPLLDGHYDVMALIVEANVLSSEGGKLFVTASPQVDTYCTYGSIACFSLKSRDGMVVIKCHTINPFSRTQS